MNGLCCLRLNTAGVIIGWIGAVLSLVSIILLGLGLGNLDELTKAILDNNPKASADLVRQTLIIVISFNLTLNIINMVASAMLVAGTIKERHLMLVPWLINAGFWFFLNAVSSVYFVVMTFQKEGEPVDAGIISMLIVGGILGIQFYIWYAIYSLFRKISTDREQRQQLLPTTGSSYPSYTKI